MNLEIKKTPEGKLLARRLHLEPESRLFSQTHLGAEDRPAERYHQILYLGAGKILNEKDWLNPVVSSMCPSRHCFRHSRKSADLVLISNAKTVQQRQFYRGITLRKERKQ